MKIHRFLKSYIQFYHLPKPYVQEERFKSAMRKSFRKVYSLLCAIGDLIFLIPALFVVLLARAFRSFILIRFGTLQNRRIGSLASSMEMYQCRRDIEKRQGKRSLDLFCAIRPICNHQLMRMWSKKLHIYPFVSYLYRVNACLPGGEENSTLNLYLNHRDVDGLFAATQPHLSFTPKEKKIGNEALMNMGIPYDASFVCIYLRDSNYLKEHYAIDFYYHNFRDCSIRNYMLVAEKLADYGYYVLRMGKNVKEEFKTTNLRIIDYATKFRTDFLDIFLSAHCRFFIGGPAGLTEVPKIFRRPITWVNFVPLGDIHWWDKNGLFIPKKLWHKRDQRFLCFREIIGSEIGRFYQTQQYEQSEIEAIENSPEEILDLAIEMDERLKGTWQTTREDEELQQHFWSLFRQSESNHKILARIGTKFLRQNKELLN